MGSLVFKRAENNTSAETVLYEAGGRHHTAVPRAWNLNVCHAQHGKYFKYQL